MWGIFIAFGPQVLGRMAASVGLGLHPRLLSREGAFWRRALVALAGPAASVLLAMATVFALHLIYGAPYESESAVVADVRAGGPADQSGMKRGDVILSLDGQPVPKDRVPEAVDRTGGRPFALEVERAGARQTLTLHAAGDGGHWRIGIRVDQERQWRPISLGEGRVLRPGRHHARGGSIAVAVAHAPVGGIDRGHGGGSFGAADRAGAALRAPAAAHGGQSRKFVN